MNEYLESAARVVWDDNLANLYLYESQQELETRKSLKPQSCPSCNAIWVPGVSCYVRTVTDHNLNKRNRSEKQKKLQRYLYKCQKHKSFTPKKQIKVQYECKCAHKLVTTVLLPEVHTGKAQKQDVNKSKSARQRSKKRRGHALDQPDVNPLAALAKPSLSLNDFLL